MSKTGGARLEIPATCEMRGTPQSTKNVLTQHFFHVILNEIALMTDLMYGSSNATPIGWRSYLKAKKPNQQLQSAQLCAAAPEFRMAA